MLEPNRKTYSFGGFEIDPQRRLLLRQGKVVPLTSKTFDLLLVLVESAGRELTKDELMERVWPDQIVEDGNLTVTMSNLRKALGEKASDHHYIVTVPGRGYRFVAELLDPSRNAEYFIESRTSSQIVVEEEFSEETEKAIDAEWRRLPNAVEASETGVVKTAGISRALQTRESLFTRRGLVILSVALIGLLLLSAVASIWLYRSRNRQTAATVPPLPSNLRRFTTHGGVPTFVAISPDGKSLAYIQRLGGKDSLWLGQIEANSSVPIYEKQDLANLSPSFSPDGSSIYFVVGGPSRPRSMLARIPVLGGAVTELIPSVHSSATFSPDGTQLAFLRTQDRQTSIVIANTSDGKNERVLLTRKAPENFSSIGIAWSPDGKSLAFGAVRLPDRDALFVVNLADQSVSQVGGRDWGNVINVAWLPDGSGILAMVREIGGERRRDIWLVAYPSGEARIVTNDLNVFLQDRMSVSANGKVAVLQGVINADIWVAPNGDANTAHRVLRGVAPRYEGIDGLSWTQDERILYTAYVNDSNTIWSMNKDGSDIKQLTPSKANVFDREINATADGRYVIFQSNRSGNSQIWRVNIDGSNLQQLTDIGNNSIPCVSPDGQWIVFTSNRSGRSTLWRMTIDGKDQKQLTDKPSSWPRVSPDGKYISYTGPDESNMRLMVMAFDGGEPFKSFAVPEYASRGRLSIQWTPDGRAILYKDGRLGLWRQALDEEEPQQVKGFEQLTLRLLAWSFDGRNLAYSTGLSTQEIIIIENFK